MPALHFPTHKYTLQNYKFALSMEPNNAELAAAIDEAKARRAEGLPTVPSTIAKELATNPFMRVLNPVIQVREDIAHTPPTQTFTDDATQHNETVLSCPGRLLSHLANNEHTKSPSFPHRQHRREWQLKQVLL